MTHKRSHLHVRTRAHNKELLLCLLQRCNLSLPALGSNIQTETQHYFGQVRSTAVSPAHLEPYSSLIPSITHTHSNTLCRDNSYNSVHRQIETHHRSLYAVNTFAVDLTFDFAGVVKLIFKKCLNKIGARVFQKYHKLVKNFKNLLKLEREPLCVFSQYN